MSLVWEVRLVSTALILDEVSEYNNCLDCSMFSKDSKCVSLCEWSVSSEGSARHQVDASES